MRRSTVFSNPVELVFPGYNFVRLFSFKFYRHFFLAVINLCDRTKLECLTLANIFTLVCKATTFLQRLDFNENVCNSLKRSSLLRQNVEHAAQMFITSVAGQSFVCEGVLVCLIWR
jgi:hypothetical protein